MISRQTPIPGTGSRPGRHRLLRWSVPVSVAAVIALIASGVLHSERPSAALPQTTPAALLASVGTPTVTGFSGTVVSHISLGLPDLPSIGDLPGGSPLASLLSGSRTLQVWYGGVDKQRVALLGTTDETDLFRSGRSLWRWDSADHEADHLRVPTGSGTQTPGLAALTPAAMASMALTSLKSLRPTTRITVRSDRDVADRAAYELILQPKTVQTRIASVHIAIDGRTKVPLGVQVYARGSSTPAIDVSYSSIRFAAPSDTTFDFSPPMGAKVRHLSMHALRRSGALTPERLTLAGPNWAGVLGYDTKRPVHLAGLGLGRALTRVSGAWGSGRLLQTSLVSVLLLHDGRVFAGAVDPSELYAAAARTQRK
ncbi:hypothetical protein [Jatrophihabitans endophyticus]|uniref:LolA family protein n=1 Tax=Jatrophihabitans endophyticus TaxID=1206085 RepID=UPI0019EA969F|nr:hypothetical protein [Jatrophihabitans endophyticus]MBE7189661.1 hypothetical protein [Jatrophihabitans endophyticus]